MLFKRFILVYLFFSLSIFANEDCPDWDEFIDDESEEFLARDISQDAIAPVPMLANLESEPTSFVNGVNVITGTYTTMSTDISLPGPENLCLARHYSSRGSSNGNLARGWNFNHQGELTVYHIDKPYKCFATMREGFGSEAVYLSNKENKPITFSLSPEILKRHITNSSSGQISARSNIKNYSILDVKRVERECTVVDGSGTKRTFERKHPHDDSKKNPFYIQKEVKPSGNNFQYLYEPHGDYRLTNIQLRNSKKNILNEIKFSYAKDFKKTLALKASSSDQRKIQYNFKHAAHVDLLMSVEQTGALTENYKYDQYGRMVSKSLPGNRFQNIAYYEIARFQDVGGTKVELYGTPGEQRAKRVKTLSAPVGTDEKPIITQRFFYNINSKNEKKEPDNPKSKYHYRPGEGNVDVRNAYDRKTEYHFGDDQRLKTIAKYTGTSGNYAIYSGEHLKYGASGTKDEINLISRTFVSKELQNLFCRYYQYDARGNISYDCLMGNLSGQNPFPLVVNNGIPQFNGCEGNTTTYKYSTDGLNLLTYEADGRHHIYYYYVPGTELISSILTGGAQINIRQFFEYDVNGMVTRKITDNGSTPDKTNLTSVTQRRITYTAPREVAPIGLPYWTEERALNTQTGLEHLLSKTVYAYTPQGLLKKQDHYDCDGKYVYSWQWDHDAYNNVILQIDPVGRTTTYRYDLNNNKVFEQGPLAGFHKEFFYDFSNRLIRIDEVYGNGIRLSQNFRYDYLSNKIASTDICGNETQYVYDDFSRLIKTIYPTVLDAYGVAVNPTACVAYDTMSNPVAKTDANGNTTYGTYNIRGQPCLTSYPDGTNHQTLYHHDGAVANVQGKNHLHAFNEHIDYQKRPLFTSYYFEGAGLQDWKQTDYDAFNIVRESTLSGLSTEYTYDFAGRLASVTKQDRLTTYSYDSLGHLNKTYEYFGNNNSDYIVHVNKNDVLGRVIEERVEDSQGNILRKTQYGYDVQGNKNKIVSFSEAGEAVTDIIYNSHNLAWKVTDALGNSIITIFNYNYRNSLGQIVPYNETIDPMGNVTATTQDALNRVVSIVKKNAMGRVIQSQEFSYDFNGNRVGLKETVISENASDRVVYTHWTYDSCNKVTSITEAVGTPDQKKTAIVYNAYGQKQTIINPDGSTVEHTYDFKGRLKSYIGSDNSLAYTYEYDQNNNPIKVNDLINETSTTNIYDQNNRCVQETLNNGLTIQYQYDRLDRPVRTIFPDNSTVEYAYQASDLKTVTRLDASNTVLYSHTYSSYDLAGKVLESKMIGNAGSSAYTYDILGRCMQVNAPHWQSAIPKYDNVGNILQRDVTDSKGTSQCNYQYDDLYQLKTEDGLASHSYAHDSLYNRVNKDGNVNQINDLNQLISDSQKTYAYDYNGNLVHQIGDRDTAYTFDALGRLLTATTGSQQVKYIYDHQNRRLSKTISNWNANTSTYEPQTQQRFIFVGQNEVGSCDSSGNIQEFRVLGFGKGAEIGSTVAIELGNRVFGPIHDHNGNIVSLIDAATGLPAETYRYSAFGEEEILDASGNAQETTLNPWRFSSKRFDEETGFVFFGNRYYNPNTGRWLTPDPKGFEAGPNLYAYVSNNPLTHYDLYGLIEAAGESQGGGWFSGLSSWWGEFKKSWGPSIEGFGRQVPIPIVRDYIEILGHNWSGQSFDGWKPSWYVHSRWEMIHPGDGSVNHALVYVNGIDTMYEDIKARALNAIGWTGGVPSIYILHNASRGIIIDVLETFVQRLGISTNPTRIGVKNMQMLAEQMGPGGQITIFPHSQGGTIVHEMGSRLSQEIRDMTEVYAFAPASIIPDGMFKNAVNYVSKTEYVSLSLNPITCLLAKINKDPNIKFVDTIGPAYKAHSFEGPTYAKPYNEILNTMFPKEA